MYTAHFSVAFAERLERIVRAVGDPAQVILGTDCGLDTLAEMVSAAE